MPRDISNKREQNLLVRQHCDCVTPNTTGPSGWGAWTRTKNN